MEQFDAARAERLARALDSALDPRQEGLSTAEQRAIQDDDPELAALLRLAANLEQDVPDLMAAGDDGLPEPPTVFLRDLRGRLLAALAGIAGPGVEPDRRPRRAPGPLRHPRIALAGLIVLATAVAGAVAGVGRLTPVAVEGPAITAVQHVTATAGGAATLQKPPGTSPAAGVAQAPRFNAAIRPQTVAPALPDVQPRASMAHIRPMTGTTHANAGTAASPPVTATIQGTASSGAALTAIPGPRMMSGSMAATRPATTSVPAPAPPPTPRPMEEVCPMATSPPGPSVKPHETATPAPKGRPTGAATPAPIPRSRGTPCVPP